jgi:hypothetical protein
LRGFGDVRQCSLGVFLEEVEVGRHCGGDSSCIGGEVRGEKEIIGEGGKGVKVKIKRRAPEEVLRCRSALL